MVKTKIDVEVLLQWAYGAQRVDRVGARAGVGPRGYGNAFGMIQQLEVLGCAVDCSRTGDWVGPGVHPDAEALHDAVVRVLTPGARQLVIAHAVAADRPDAMVGVTPRLVRTVNRKGKPEKPKRRYDIHRNAKGWRVLHRLVPAWSEIVYARAQWTVWRAALGRVADEMAKTALTDHVVSGPCAPLSPWKY
ncbi:MAG: hypothetical protein HQL35_14825 [Alphaproteobacteria bacterium]|nr:hypothetical protein [Alphaproteobacteria bacterium]